MSRLRSVDCLSANLYTYHKNIIFRNNISFMYANSIRTFTGLATTLNIFASLYYTVFRTRKSHNFKIINFTRANFQFINMKRRIVNTNKQDSCPNRLPHCVQRFFTRIKLNRANLLTTVLILHKYIIQQLDLCVWGLARILKRIVNKIKNYDLQIHRYKLNLFLLNYCAGEVLIS